MKQTTVYRMELEFSEEEFKQKLGIEGDLLNVSLSIAEERIKVFVKPLQDKKLL